MLKKKILIIGPSWVGDMIMAHSLVKLLKKQDPNISIDMAAQAATISIAKRLPGINKTIRIPIGHGEFKLTALYQLGKQLRESKYDQAIILTNTIKSALLAFFAKIPTRTGWLGEKRYILLNDIKKRDKKTHPLMIEQFMQLGLNDQDTLPQDISAYYPSLMVDLDRQKALIEKFNIDQTKPIIALCPGAAYGPAKRWAAKYFAQVAENQINKDRTVLLVGSNQDLPAGQLIQTHAPNVISLIGKTTLLDAIDLLALSQMVVTNDSGLMHVTSALQRPLIAIYGSSSPCFTPPLSDRASIVSLNLPCSPCFKRTCPLEHLDCLNKLMPEQIIERMEETIQRFL